MPGPTLTCAELADELGRSRDWLYEHWRRLMLDQDMPGPLNLAERPLVWNRAQIYAWLDRGLPKEVRIAAQAYRAAAAAAAEAPHVSKGQLETIEWEQRLGRRFAPDRQKEGAGT